MAHPERPQTPTDPAEALAAIKHQLELTEENENPIERFFKQDELLEQLDWLQAEISSPEPAEK